MVIGEQGLDDSQNQNIGTIQQTETPEGPTSESLELMESIIQRLQPTDRHDIREMISFRGLVSGSLASMTAVFWWISVDKGGDSLGDADIPISLIGEFTFSFNKCLAFFLCSGLSLITNNSRNKVVRFRI